MNEFTKEELIEIKRCADYMINGGITPYSSLTIEVKKKANSILNKYCGHKKSQAHAMIVRKCDKCEEIW